MTNDTSGVEPDVDPNGTESTTEAENEAVAAAIDNALIHALGPRRMPVSWMAVVDVADDEGDQFPVVFYSPESGWVQALGLVEAGALIVRGGFVDVVRGDESEDDDDPALD